MGKKKGPRIKPMTLQEVGQSFDPPLSRERVRQIEKIALKKCRAILSRWGLSLDDLLPGSYGSADDDKTFNRGNNDDRN